MRAQAQDIDMQYSHIEYFENLDGDFQVIHAVMIKPLEKLVFPNRGMSEFYNPQLGTWTDFSSKNNGL